MASVKSHEADRFLKSPDAKLSAVLAYGTDAGLVSERARAAARAWASLETPPSEIVRLDDADLDDNPDKLAIELMTVPMFGGRKVIHAVAGRRINARMLKAILDEAPLPGVLIVEAGNLKPSDTLRSTFEKSRNAAAIACYPDESRDLSALVDEEIAAAGMQISADARELLVAQLGADRALSRGEVGKLILYCAGRKTIEAADIEAVVSDASELNVDRIVHAAAGGDAATAVRELARAMTSGESPQTVLIALQRHFHRLHRLQADIDAGRSAADAIKGLRPPLHFKQKSAVTAQLRKWTGARLATANDAIARATRNARQTGARDDLITEQLVLALAQRAR